MVPVFLELGRDTAALLCWVLDDGTALCLRQSGESKGLFPGCTTVLLL